MKALDVLGTGVKAAAKVIVAAVAPPALSRDAAEELRRRADVNARTAAARAEREAEMFGGSRWLRRRPGWLGRGR